MDTIDTSPEKSAIGFQILYKNLPRVQKSGHRDTERRLDIIGICKQRLWTETTAERLPGQTPSSHAGWQKARP